MLLAYNISLDCYVEFSYKIYEIVYIISFSHTIIDHNLQSDPIVKFYVCRRAKEKKIQMWETKWDQILLSDVFVSTADATESMQWPNTFAGAPNPDNLHLDAAS